MMNSSLSPDSKHFEQELQSPVVPAMELSEREEPLPASGESAEKGDDSLQSHYPPEPLEIPVELLTPRGETLFRRGMEALREGETDEALEIWRRAREEFPRYGIIAHNLGLAEVAAGQFKSAIQSFSSAYELDKSLAVSNSNSIYAGLEWKSYQERSEEVIEQCEELRNAGRWEESEALAWQLLDEYPGSAAAHAELSLNFSHRWSVGSMDDTALLLQALEYAQRSIFLDSTYPGGFAAASTAQSHLGMHREAYLSLEQMLEVQEEVSAETLLFCGEMALQGATAEDNDLILAQKAVDYADRVIREEPDNLRAWTLRAQSHAIGVSRGVVSIADNLADFERLLELDPDNGDALEARDFLRAQCRNDKISSELEPVLDEALGYLEANENEKALPLLRSILESEPDNRPTLNNLSLALRRLKRLDEALPVQTHLAEIDSTPESWRLVATLALQMNLLEEANKAYVEVVRLSPTDARAHSAVATTLEQLERKEESIPSWRRVVKLTPHDDMAWFHLGENLLESAYAHDPVDEALLQEALPALKRAYALDTEHVEALRYLALAHAELGESDAALDCASRLATHRPENHDSLVATLTDIHSRRLSEGLASRPSGADLLPALLPPRLPVENAGAGEQLAIESFSTVSRKSISPIVVGIVGLIAIFGALAALRSLFPPPPDIDRLTIAPPPPRWGGGTLGSPSAPPPLAAPVPPASQIVTPLTATTLTGWWTGTFDGDSARLLISTASSTNSFLGTLYIDSGSSAGLKLFVEGNLSGQNISWRERKIIANPSNSGWSLGKETGTVTQGGNEMQMSGNGKDATGITYQWAFSRNASAASSPTSATNEIPSDWVSAGDGTFSLKHPADWTHSFESVGKQARVSINAPQNEVRLVVEVSPPSSNSPLSLWQMENNVLRSEYGKNYRLLKLEEAPLGGEPGVKWEFVLKKPEETQLRKIKRSVVHNGRNYELSMAAPADEFDDWLLTFNRIVDSFSFR